MMSINAAANCISSCGFKTFRRRQHAKNTINQIVFYVLLLPLAEQIVFWQAYTIAASACVGLIGWYSYYVFGGLKRALIFTATLAGLYAAFFGILSTEDLNLLLGAIFCFMVLACVMVMTRKLDWYKVT